MSTPRTITNPATGSSVSSSVIRNELQTLENEIAALTFNSKYSETISFSGVTGTLANTPISGTVRLYRNGVRQNAGAFNDYTISSSTITLTITADPNENFLADYNY